MATVTTSGVAPPTYDNAGTIVSGVRETKRTATGPASYTQGTGIAVDLSGVFATLHGVRVLRAYVTSTLAADTRRWVVHEAGTDTFANRKFRLLAYIGGTPAGTNGAPGVTTDANVLKATGSVSAVNTINASGLTGTCGAVGCDSDHPNGASAVPNTLTASGPSKVEAVLTVAAPTFTGTAETALAEIAATTNLSTITVEYVATGVI